MSDGFQTREPSEARDQAEGRLAKESKAITAIVDDMLRGEVDDAETERRVLDACLDATDSDYGMIGVINEHSQYDTTTYNSRTLHDCAFPEALAWELSTGMPIRGIWGWPMLHGEALTCNDLQAHPDRVGQPKGHVPIHCYLGVPLKREGKVVGMVAVANKPSGYTQEDRDSLIRLAAVMAVSQEHRRAVLNLKKVTAELERSNRELEQFASVASHDLQEPLRMVASFTQLLARRYEGKLDASADKFIGYAVDGANRLQRMINDLLAYSRVSVRGKPFAPVECEAALEGVLANLRLTFEENGAIVTHDPLPTVSSDVSQLVQLLQNLIGNAIKFRSREPPRIHISAERQPDEWVFAVRDNGIGMDRHHRERIFVIFQRLHTREEYTGTGIGLAVCKKIVERHGGRIWVESEPDKGSTFYFTIPAE